MLKEVTRFAFLDRQELHALLTRKKNNNNNNI